MLVKEPIIKLIAITCTKAVNFGSFKKLLISGALKKMIKKKQIPKKIFKQKTDDKSVSVVSCLRINACENPLSINVLEMAKKMAVIPTKPKSAGDNSLAKIILIKKVNPYLENDSMNDQERPDMVFCLRFKL